MYDKKLFKASLFTIVDWFGFTTPTWFTPLTTISPPPLIAGYFESNVSISSTKSKKVFVAVAGFPDVGGGILLSYLGI